MSKCKICGSYAINHHCHGRDGSDGDLCDVCYWRKRAEQQPPRQPLTDEQIADAVRGFYSSDEAAELGFPDDACTARAIEAAHNIK